jgi:hypothetical protein
LDFVSTLKRPSIGRFFSATAGLLIDVSLSFAFLRALRSEKSGANS